MIEVWKDINGYEGFYQVSNKGRVRSLTRTVTTTKGVPTKYEGKLLSTTITAGRYAQVGLCKDGKRVVHSVHRLVAEAFVPNPNNYEYVNHIDWDRENNCADNLEWCTKEYNNQNRKNCLKFRH